MKKKAILIFAITLAGLLIVGISVSAQGNGWEYYACGTIDGYEYAPAAEIVPSGFWNLKVEGDKIWLTVKYLETNLYDWVEGAPVDSVDILEYSMTGKPMVYIEEDDKLEIFAVMRLTKTAAQWDGTYKQDSWKTWLWFTFDFDTHTIHIDGWPGEADEADILGSPDDNDPDTYDWDRVGTITAFNYPVP